MSYCKTMIKAPKDLLITVLACAPLMAFAGESTHEPECALLWKVSSESQGNGYLFGTIHAEDPRVLDVPFLVQNALQQSEAFAMEVIPDPDALMSLAQQMHYQDGRNLREVVGEALFQEAVTALGIYGIGQGVAIKMKPWAVAMTLSIPPPETGIFLDMQLYLDARMQLKPVFGLETVSQQLHFFEALSDPMQVLLLQDALAHMENAEETFESLISAYLTADLEHLSQLNQEQLATTPGELAEWLMSEGIEKRNLKMLARMREIMQSQSVFVAVGALHLPGDAGLIALLRKAGFTLQRQGASAQLCAQRQAALE